MNFFSGRGEKKGEGEEGWYGEGGGVGLRGGVQAGGFERNPLSNLAVSQAIS